MKIAQVIRSDSWGEITPAAFERGIGGREGAMVRLATEWARLGHEVTNFVPIKKAQRFQPRGKDSNGVYEWVGFHEYVNIGLAEPMLRSFPFDAVVAWECPSLFTHPEVRERQKVRLTHMQVAHLDEIEMEAANEYSTGMVALSEWARDFLVSSGLTQPNLYVRPNGVNMADYQMKGKFYNFKNPSFVYSSSPDRGLWHLLKMWPQIRKEYKKATLFVAYGVKNYTDTWRWSHNRVGEMCLEIEHLMFQDGVIDLGKIGQKELAKIQMNATAWFYPADTIQATETGCITAIENMAAGNVCVMSDADCLKDEFGEVAWINPLPFHAEDYLEALDNFFNLTTNDEKEETFRRVRGFAESRDWSNIAPTWIDLFEENDV